MMQSVRDGLNINPGEPLMWTASEAFTSFTNTRLVQVARMLLATSARCRGSRLPVSLVGMHEPNQKKPSKNLQL